MSSVPINGITDTTLTNMGGLLIGIDSGWYGLNFSGSAPRYTLTTSSLSARPLLFQITADNSY